MRTGIEALARLARRRANRARRPPRPIDSMGPVKGAADSTAHLAAGIDAKPSRYPISV